MAAPFARKTLTREAIVVGCGVSGLSCAIRLAEAGFATRIVARERTPHTTSDIAAAVWYPFRCGTADRGLSWSRRTFRVLRELAHDPTSGVTLVEGIDLLALAPGPLRRLRRRFQIVFQDSHGALNPRMRVGTLVAEPLAIHDATFFCAEMTVLWLRRPK